jgi:hypothetical protein
MTTLGKIVGATLGFLALFQLAEYQVCGLDMSHAMWSRVGFVAITMLPALGIHMVREVSGKGSMSIVYAAYASCFMFAGTFGLNPAAFQGHVCAGNYAVFQLASPLGGAYFTYYYFWLLFGIGMAWYYSNSVHPDVRKALYLQIAGYTSFMLPTGAVNTLNPQTLQGIPSIMCGFAVTYALIIVFGIVPLVLRRRDSLQGAAIRLKH